MIRTLKFSQGINCWLFPLAATIRRMEGLLWLHRRTKGNRQSEWRVVAYGEIVVECFVTFHHDFTLRGMCRDTHRVRASGMAVACRASSNFTVWVQHPTIWISPGIVYSICFNSYDIRLKLKKNRRLTTGIVERLYDTKRHLSCMIEIRRVGMFRQNFLFKRDSHSISPPHHFYSENRKLGYF